MPHIGQLRERVSFLEPIAEDATASGYVRQNFETYRQCWAQVDYQAGAEGAGHDSRDATFNVVVTIRYPERVPATTDAIELPGDRVANILSVRDPDGRRRWLEVICRGPA